MVQWQDSVERAFPAKPDYLSSARETHTAESKNQLRQLSSNLQKHALVHTDLQAHRDLNKQMLLLKLS